MHHKQLSRRKKKWRETQLALTPILTSYIKIFCGYLKTHILKLTITSKHRFACRKRIQKVYELFKNIYVCLIHSNEHQYKYHHFILLFKLFCFSIVLLYHSLPTRVPKT